MLVRDYFVQLYRLTKEEGGGWHLVVPDLPGCSTDGDTFEEAANNIEDAIDTWIATARDLGREIPAPAEVQEYRA